MTAHATTRARLRAVMAGGSTLFVLCCGGSSPAAPSTPARPPASVSDRIRFRTEPGGVVNYRGIGLAPAVSYYGCYEFRNDGPGSATITLTLTPLGPDGTAYPVAANTTAPVTFSVGGNSLGCGSPTAIDFDMVHPEPTRYRLRLDATFTDGLSGAIEKEDVLESTLYPPKVTGIVISEFRQRGPRGAEDQFIELHNVSSSPVAMSEWSIDTWDSRTLVFTAARTFNGTLGPGCHYLIGPASPSGVSERVPNDTRVTVSLLDKAGGFALRDRFGRVIDQVGLAPESVFREGQLLTPLLTDTNRSYARTGADTNDNARDFVVVSPSRPENSTMCGPG